MFGSNRSKYKGVDDATLLDKYLKSRDLEQLGALYHRYMHLVYGVCLKYFKNPESSKDAVMQIFEKLVEVVHKQEIRNFKSWLYVVTRNHCLMTLRSSQAIVENISSFMETGYEQHLNGEEDFRYQTQLRKALKSLPDHQQVCLQLFYYQNRSYQEISEETGYSLKKVKSYIQNGKRKLKIFLESNEG